VKCERVMRAMLHQLAKKNLHICHATLFGNRRAPPPVPRQRIWRFAVIARSFSVLWNQGLKLMEIAVLAV
jgi:hypothetical protein